MALTLSLLSPYVSLYDLNDLDVFPYDSDTHTPFPSLSSQPSHKISRTRSIGSRLWTTHGDLDDLDDFPTSQTPQ